MKTLFAKARTGTLVAALAAMLSVGTTLAEEEGVVRLGSRALQPTYTAQAHTGLTVRGQSGQDQPATELFQRLSGEYDFTSNSCDACCPTDACCPADACCPVDECCPADVCCPGEACDGCDGGYGANGNGCGFGDGAGRHGRFGGLFGGRHGRCCNRCGCSNCGGDGCGCGCGCGNGNGFWARHCAAHRARNRCNSAQMCNYLRCKLGYFIPDGCGGVGCRPFGCYRIVYADNPAHFDGRDGQVYAAQGVGGPVSVPVAPNVRHAYNYGWGIPSSRLTPISNAAY
ncbi:MAG: hypothetical protein KF861_09375 [Planctomycetaceae bacterium]|nr:hypothetical protein [Planctomycetaceae bacterium]